MSLLYDRALLVDDTIGVAQVVLANEVRKWLLPPNAVACRRPLPSYGAFPPFLNIWVEWNNRIQRDGVIFSDNDQTTGVHCRAACHPDGSWTTEFEIWIECRVTGHLPQRFSHGTWAISPDGGCADAGTIQRDMPAVLQEQFGAAVLTLFYTFQLMNCPPSNVPRALHTPGYFYQRRWRRQTGRALASYYTLDIGPSPEEQRIFNRSRNQDAAAHRAPRLHWVRGHFMAGHHVCGEKPQGVWRRPHLRGNASSGVALKNYNVRVPSSNLAVQQ